MPIVSNGAVFSYFLTVNPILFSAFYLPLSSSVITNFREVKCPCILCSLCGFVPSVMPAVNKGPSNSVLCHRGTSCDLSHSNRRNPSSNSQWQIALGINQHWLGNTAYQHQLKTKYFQGTRSSEFSHCCQLWQESFIWLQFYSKLNWKRWNTEFKLTVFSTTKILGFVVLVLWL